MQWWVRTTFDGFLAQGYTYLAPFGILCEFLKDTSVGELADDRVTT